MIENYTFYFSDARKIEQQKLLIKHETDTSDSKPLTLNLNLKKRCM